MQIVTIINILLFFQASVSEETPGSLKVGGERVQKAAVEGRNLSLSKQDSLYLVSILVYTCSFTVCDPSSTFQGKEIIENEVFMQSSSLVFNMCMFWELLHV